MLLRTKKKYLHLYKYKNSRTRNILITWMAFNLSCSNFAKLILFLNNISDPISPHCLTSSMENRTVRIILEIPWRFYQFYQQVSRREHVDILKKKCNTVSTITIILRSTKPRLTQQVRRFDLLFESVIMISLTLICILAGFLMTLNNCRAFIIFRI